MRPLLLIFLGFRAIYYFVYRVFVCEPLFKAYCTRYGRNLRTDVYIHWVQGTGDLIFGDDVLVDGKCSFVFANRFAERPALIVGDRSLISHQCQFVVAQRITIGSDCLIAAGVRVLDSSGHPTDPAARLAHLPPPSNKIRPVSIGNNVWIGAYSVILPGVTVGDGSVIATNSVVRTDVPANTIFAGNPAKQVGVLKSSSSMAGMPITAERELPRPAPIRNSDPI